MKFGETLYQRSLPQWAAYNVSYNEIKQLIKEQTSSGLAVPVSIPSASSNSRWAALEDDLLAVFKEQHDNVSLFLKSKYGEIDRKLNYLEKQVRSARKAARLPRSNPSVSDRRYRKLSEDAEAIGHDIQSLTRFAGVQKTAFRKLLKKYRKWTGSTSLQTRLENEVFCTGQLNLDYAHPLDRLAKQSRVILLLQTPLGGGQPEVPIQDQALSPTVQSTSAVNQIQEAEEKGPVALDAALATIPFGKSAGSASYWIHPDNLDEAQALLLRYVREVHKPAELSRQSSSLSAISGSSRDDSTDSGCDGTHIAFLDNLQRFLQDQSSNRPSRIALSGRWCQDAEAAVTLSNLAPWNPASTIVNVKRKDLYKVMSREIKSPRRHQKQSPTASNIQKVEEYLAEHRDVKPLANVHTTRSRYVGSANSSQVGVWAILDSDVTISPFDDNDSSIAGQSNAHTESGEAFPHSILEIRWEFSHTPEVVRAFDTTHLAERVRGFTIESAAIHIINKQLPSPAWNALLEKDIRKVPITTKLSFARRSSNNRRTPTTGSSSGPSSTDGPSDSVFSTAHTYSSATSIDSPVDSTRDSLSPTESKLPSAPPSSKRKKRARFSAQSPPPSTLRYWNEFDDGDEDVNSQEAYTIDVNPDQSILPGSETVSKAFGAMYKSLGDAKSRVTSMLSLRTQPPDDTFQRSVENRPLLGAHSRNTSYEASSSESDHSPVDESSPMFGTFTTPQKDLAGAKLNSLDASPKLYRPQQILTPRQRTLERTYLWFYTGLLALSYILLCICGVLLATGRKKAKFEVDTAVVVGIATAATCAVLSSILLWRRRMPLGIFHKTCVYIAVTGVFVVGLFEIAKIVTQSAKK